MIRMAPFIPAGLWLMLAGDRVALILLLPEGWLALAIVVAATFSRTSTTR